MDNTRVTRSNLFTATALRPGHQLELRAHQLPLAGAGVGEGRRPRHANPAAAQGPFPLGLTATANSDTPAIPEPALHAFTSERRAALKIPAGVPFYEESTFWNPSWTITHGAIQTTTIYDMEATAVGIGSGRLLSADSYKKMVSTELRGKTRAQPGCPTCFEQNDGYSYGLGIVISGHWLLQNPMFAGYAAVEAYLPSQRVAVAVAVTYAPEAFDDQGNYRNQADILFRKIGAEVAPNDAPPMPPGR